jgi:hypothetical protein
MIPYTTEDTAYLIETHHTHSARQQAAALGRTLHSITSKRRELLRAGLVSPARRAWTHNELDDVIEALQDGLPTAAISKKLGTRSTEAVRAVLPRRRMPIRGIRAGVIAVRTPLAVSILFGVHNRVVYDWIKERLLHARRSNPSTRARHAQRLVSDEALLRFIHDRRTWFRFDPRRITCPDWRRAAITARRGGRWVSVNELAHLLCCSAPYARVLVREGRLELETARHARQWYVWVDDGAKPTIPAGRNAA